MAEVTEDIDPPPHQLSPQLSPQLSQQHSPQQSRPARKSSLRLKAERRTLLWVVAGGLIVRFLYFVEHSHSVFYRVPILDEAFYDAVARAIASGGDVASINPGFRPLLYPGLLALAYRPSEFWSWPLALGVQHLLGLVIAVTILRLATRLFDRPAAGALAAGLYLLAGPPLFFEGELLIATLFTALGAVLLGLLATTRLDGWWWSWPAAGALVGVMAEARGNALILVLAFPLAAVLLPGVANWRRRLGLASLALAGTLASLTVAALWQEPMLGRFELLPGGGGVNLYLGNKRGADGMVPRQDQHASYGDSYRDSVQVFSYQAYRRATGDRSKPPDPGAVSRYWIGQAAHEIAADPLAWTRLMARKTLLLVWNREIPNNKSFAFIAREESRLLGALPVRFWLLLALAGVGAVAFFEAAKGPRPPNVAQRSLALWLGLYLALLGSAVVLFFVTARYRLPLWPALAVFAGGGALAVLDLVAALARRRPAIWLTTSRARWWAAGTFAALATLSAVNWLSVPPIEPHRDYFFRSLASFEKEDLESALADAKRSVELEPRDAAARFQLAKVYLALDDVDLAEEHLLQAAVLAPREPRILNQLGVILERRGETSPAYQSYVRATELGPTFSPAFTNAALLELRANALGRAKRSIDRAEKLGDRSVALQCARAFLEIKRGRVEIGKALLRGALRRDRELVKRLVQEQEQPLHLGRGDRALGDKPPDGRDGEPAEDP